MKFPESINIRSVVLLIMLVVILCLQLSACSTAPKKPDSMIPGDYSYTKERLAWLINKEMSEHNASGLSVALVDNQKIVWAKGFGYADRLNHQFATADTLYRIGSISKVFTATAVMKMVEQGKMALDAPLQDYLENFSIKNHFATIADVTPGNIMTHHSGLPSDYVKGSWTKHPFTGAELVSKVKEEYLAAPPNLVLAYSNLGFTLLGNALANVAGESFSGHMKKSLFLPLGMSRSTFEIFAPKTTDVSKAYSDSVEREIFGTGNLSAGGMWSSVNDLAKFLQMIFANDQAGEQQIIKPSTLASMLQPQNSGYALDFDQKIGYSWFLSESLPEAGFLVEHGGGTAYFRSQLKMLPQHKLGIVVLCNSESCKDVVNKVSHSGLKLLYESKTGKSIKTVRYKKPKRLLKPTVMPYELSGVYASGAGLIQVVKDGDNYVAKAMGKEFELIPREGGYFSLQYRLFGIIPWSFAKLGQIMLRPVKIRDRQVLTLKKHNHEKLFAEKFTPVKIPESWRAWYGVLEITNPDEKVILKDIRMGEENNVLIVSYRAGIGDSKRKKIPLLPINEELAVIAGLGRGHGMVIRIVTTKSAKRISFSGYELKKAHSVNASLKESSAAQPESWQ